MIYESIMNNRPKQIPTLELAYADTPNEAQLQLMSSGLEIMVGVLGGIVQRFDTKEIH